MPDCLTCEVKDYALSIKSIQDYTNALDTGQKWPSTTLKYYFYKTSDPDPSDAYTRRDWDESQKANYRTAINKWSAVCALELTETTVLGEADIKLILINDNTYPYLGHAYFPGDVKKGENYVSYNNAINKDFPVGSFDYITLVHEMGHTLGLAHPHDNGGSSSTFPGVNTWFHLGFNKQNQTVYTVMSYNDISGPITANSPLAWGFIGGPMAYDIEVVKNKYGAVAQNTGNNVYKIKTTNAPGTYFSAINDTGGVDTISAARADKNVKIDLRAATLNADGGKLSKAAGVYGGFTIAKGTKIENAVGGRKHDTLVGNNLNNRLHGGRGRDRLVAGRGRDVAHGGAGNDVFIPGPGRNTFYGGAGRKDKVVFQGRIKNYRIVKKGKWLYHIIARNRKFRRKSGFTITKNIELLQFKGGKIVRLRR